MTAGLMAVVARGANVPPVVAEPFPAIWVGVGSGPVTNALDGCFDDPDVGTAVVFAPQAGTAAPGPIVLGLHDRVAPATVSNFLNYVTNGLYDQIFVNRSEPGFLIQGGGFYFAQGGIYDNPTFPPVTNEFRDSNVRGTIAMAKRPGDPDSATCEWFINLADNSSQLDTQNGGFTVFGHVVAGTMAYVDWITLFPVYDASGVLGSAAFAELPLAAPTMDLSPSRFVTFASAFVIPRFAYQIDSNSAPGVASVWLTNWSHLVVAPGTAGVAYVTVRALDLDEASVTNVLRVVVGGTNGYEAWRGWHGLGAGAPGQAGSDPDDDQRVNLLEYALGTAPTQRQPSTNGLAFDSDPGGGARRLWLTFPVPADARLQHRVQTSDNLTQWTTLWARSNGWTHPAVLATQAVGSVMRVSVGFTNTTAPRQYLRLQVDY